MKRFIASWLAFIIALCLVLLGSDIEVKELPLLSWQRLARLLLIVLGMNIFAAWGGSAHVFVTRKDQ